MLEDDLLILLYPLVLNLQEGQQEKEQLTILDSQRFRCHIMVDRILLRYKTVTFGILNQRILYRTSNIRYTDVVDRFVLFLLG